MPFGPVTISGRVRLLDILGVDQKPGQTSEMVAMQMADTHHVDFVRLEPEPMHPDQRRDAAIDEEGGVAGTDMERGLQADRRRQKHPRTL